MRRVDAAAVEQPQQVVGRGGLAGERPRLVHARLERMHRAHQRVDRQRRADVRRPAQSLGAGQGKREDRGGHLRAINECEAFLGFERDRREAGLLQRLRAGHAIAIFTFADQHQREMGQRCQVAAGANRAAARYSRMDAAVEQRE